MAYVFNPFTSQFDYFKDDFSVVSHSTDTILTATDLKKVHVMDVSGGNRLFTLPDIDSSHVGSWIMLVKSGTNQLRINASGTDRILNTTAGGYILCTDATRTYSSLMLIVTEDGQWGTPLFGIWSTY